MSTDDLNQSATAGLTAHLPLELRQGLSLRTLYDRQGRISTFHAEALPLVAAVVRGWGMETVVIHAQPTPELPERALRKQAKAQWTFLTQA